MNQLTVRGFDRDLERRLRKVARERGVSLNRAALLLLRRGAGLEPLPPEQDVVGESLDEFIGVWSEAEEEQFLKSIEMFEQIEDSFWKKTK